MEKQKHKKRWVSIRGRLFNSYLIMVIIILMLGALGVHAIYRVYSNGSTIYYKTLKRRVAEHKRIEIEERLTQGEYLSLMMDAEPGARPLNKTRYCLTYEGQYFEIDLYPFWRDRALVEIELSDRDDEIRMPEGLKVIREVTGDPAYKNAALARLA